MDHYKNEHHIYPKFVTLQSIPVSFMISGTSFMKHLCLSKYLLLLFIFPVFLAETQAQEPEGRMETKNHEVQLSVLRLFDGTFQLGYQYMTADKSSAVIFGEVLIRENDFSETMGWGCEIQYRFYSFAGRNKIYGFYTGPYAFYRYREETFFDFSQNTLKYSTDSYVYYNILGTGVQGGLCIAAIQKLTIDFSFGAGLRLCHTRSTGDNIIYGDGIFSRNYSGVAPKINLTIGIRF